MIDPTTHMSDEQKLLWTGFDIDHLLAKAEAGDSSAQYLVAWAWIVGKKGESYEPKARTYLKQAIEAKNPKAMAFMAYLLNKGRVFPKNEKEAFQYASKAANLGNPDSQRIVGNAYYKGIGIEKDPVEALKWFLISACQDQVTVFTSVAELRKTLNQAQQDEAHRRVHEWKRSHPDVAPLHIGDTEWMMLRDAARPARRFTLQPGDPGQVFSTKVGGTPWWPKGTPRPVCSAGHRMKFVAQVLLSDVPGTAASDRALVSLHYCNECNWAKQHDTALNVRLFDQVSSPDGEGIVTEPFGAMGTPVLTDVKDYMSADDAAKVDYRGGFDIELYANPNAPRPHHGNFDNVHGHKLGGWPSWLQGAFSPECPDRQKMRFVGQIDDSFSPGVIWGGGGFAYLFVCPQSCKHRHVKVFVQFT